MSDITQIMDLQDACALAFFMLCWLGYAYSAEHALSRPNLLSIINHYRLEWMREMLKRDNRSVDAMMVGNLTRSFTFFASTAIFILAALVSLLGYHTQFTAIINTIPYVKTTTPLLWEVKIFLLILIFTHAFFKHTWSMRLYNYVSIFIAAAPQRNDRTAEHETLAAKGAALTGNAARHFNSGLRAYYFGLAGLSWFLHPYLFIAVTALVVCVTYRREYNSSTLKYLSH